jgi:hypothetical protein
MEYVFWMLQTHQVSVAQHFSTYTGMRCSSQWTEQPTTLIHTPKHLADKNMNSSIARRAKRNKIKPGKINSF